MRSIFNTSAAPLVVHTVAGIADAALGTFSGQGQATLIGRGRKTDALHSALIYCLASSIYSFDDYEQAVVHPNWSGIGRRPGAGRTDQSRTGA